MPSYQEKIQNVLQMMNRVDEFDALYAINDATKAKAKEVYIHNLSAAGDKIHLVNLADMHTGHHCSNIEKLTLIAQYILRRPDTYTIILGDAAETGTRTSVGAGIFEEDIHLREQLELLYTILKPLADAKRILGIHIGNHEFRATVALGISPMEILAQRLGVPYLGHQAFHVFNVSSSKGMQSYFGMSYHGTGGGTTMGGLINASEKGDKICANVDLYMSGHTHIKDAHCRHIYNIDPVNGVLVPQKRYYVICGSLLEYWGTYAEMQMLPPNETGVVDIALYTERKDIRVNL